MKLRDGNANTVDSALKVGVDCEGLGTASPVLEAVVVRGASSKGDADTHCP